MTHTLVARAYDRKNVTVVVAAVVVQHLYNNMRTRSTYFFSDIIIIA